MWCSLLPTFETSSQNMARNCPSGANEKPSCLNRTSSASASQVSMELRMLQSSCVKKRQIDPSAFGPNLWGLEATMNPSHCNPDSQDPSKHEPNNPDPPNDGQNQIPAIVKRKVCHSILNQRSLPETANQRTLSSNNASKNSAHRQ